MPLHPKYGEYTPGWKTIPGYPRYEVNEFSVVRNIQTGKVLRATESRVRVYVAAYQTTMKRIYHLSLLAFFPEQAPKESVDHLDNNYKNNFIENLWWCTRSENSARQNPTQDTRDRRKLKISKAIECWSRCGSYCIAKYVSTNDAVKRHPEWRQPTISDCLRGKLKTAYGFTWRFSENSDLNDLPDEVWTMNDKVKELLKSTTKQPEALSRIQISNMGRVKTAGGLVTKGLGGRYGKHRFFRDIGIHRLVWAAFGDRQPQDREQILHDDTIPLEDGRYVSNKFQHLRVGTPSENAKECWTVGGRSKFRRPMEQWSLDNLTLIKTYPSTMEILKEHPKWGLRNITTAAKHQTSRRTSYGYIWKFAPICTEDKSSESSEPLMKRQKTN